jgi:hypothetical protein
MDVTILLESSFETNCLDAGNVSHFFGKDLTHWRKELISSR